MVTPLEEGLGDTEYSQTIGCVNVIILTVGSNTSTSAQEGDCVGLLQALKRGFNESSLLCLFMHPPLRMFNRTPFHVHMSVYLDITSGTLALSSYTYTSIYSKRELRSQAKWYRGVVGLKFNFKRFTVIKIKFNYFWNSA